MLSTFSGIEMGKRALNAFRLGMQTVGHNISNMETEGYSRQVVNYGTVQPMDLPGMGQVGQGVQVEEITRIRDEFLDFQYRSNQANLGYWDKINSLYETIQNYIAEPAGEGVRVAMSTFFDAMQSVQQTPEDAAARRNLVESAQSLGTVLDSLVNGFETYTKAVNQEVLTSVQDANKMLHEIAALNKQIYHAEALDQNANDLLDQRDLLLDKLSSMMDITYNEPMGTNPTGEFFLTLNGRALIQGDHVRELVAHAFQWDGQVYYDVQVSENEFDIVDNCYVADVLTTGPDGVHQLNVDRIANGEEWTVGGGDAHCMEASSVTTAEFKDGKILTDDSDKSIPRKLSFRAWKTQTDGSLGEPVNLVVKIDWDSDNNKWALRAEKDGTQIARGDSSDAELTIEELHSFISSLLSGGANEDADLADTGMTVTMNADKTSLTFASSGEGSPIEVTDYSGMLGALSSVLYENTKVDMRTRPMSVDEALGITGSFRIQVGTQGTRVFSNNFRENAALELGVGEIIGAPKDGEDTKHTFRIGVSDQQIDITASWNGSTQRWELSSDALVAGVNVPSGMTYPAVSTGGTGANAGKVLTVADLTNFINQAASVVPDAKLNAVFSTNTEKTSQAFYIDSTNAHLISISDVEGNLAERMGIANPNPVITIDVAESDSLTIIRNKINEKYQEAFGITEPEQWVHASIQQDSDHSYYLTIAADVAGEAQRITLMGEEGGSMQVLRRLGLTANVSVGSTEDGTKVYREVAAIATKAQDASFTFDNVRYLSSDNMFSTARRIPASDSKTDYSASKMVEVSEGMWFNIKHEGIATITSRHHIKNGSIKALEEARDEVIPNLKGTLDEVAYSLVKNLNAYQYSGYGIGSDITMTGVAFFDPLSTKAGAARALSVNDAVVYDNALIGAAMGRKNAAGLAVSGVSGGSGDGSNAGRMNGLSSARILKDGTVSLGGEYDAMLAEIGADAGHAKFMYTAQSNVSEQIDQQRKAVSGVNLDEELMSIVMLNRSFGAMSRYITTIDEMLNTIINGMGLVGR
ncbi:MAG: flagellar hook-associated protein FlgK [Synergistaceae bacterium]|nr:flagellar hook-associated protein FlgK [Synergistaceae bacterium]